MWPTDELYAPSRGSFGVPVVPPTVDCDSAPTTSLTLSCEWVPFVRGALMQLLLQATWKTDAAGLLITQQRVQTLISQLAECSGPLQVPFACNGDVSFNSSPWGHWTALHGGIWTVMHGWSQTCCFVNSDSHYALNFLQIDLDAPVVIDNMRVHYGYFQGDSDEPSDVSGMHIYDVTNGANIGTPITMGAMTNGIGQTYDSGPHSGSVSQIWVVNASAKKFFADPTAQGTALITGIDISGTSVAPPC